jgi:poly-gamma-glutamate synthesis protein (capsule biosynthesis protein)
MAAFAIAAPACPPDGERYPLFGEDPAIFVDGIAKVEAYESVDTRLTGIVVPHHLLADELVALGFRAASGFRYRRIVILSPDHFRQTQKMFATGATGFETPYGDVDADRDAVAALLAHGDLIEDSCLFAKEHGVQALLPFVRHYFPEAKIVPVAMSIRSKRADWDRLVEALMPLIDEETLVVESTDFSHYLPQHEARRFDQQTLNVIAAGNPDQIAALRQPQHADSVGALYVQNALQKRRFGASPLVIANESSNAFSSEEMAETTSYNVVLFAPPGEKFDAAAYGGSKVYYLAGDTNFGRAMKLALLDPDTAERVRDAVLALTKGRPLVVNLEGVILPNVPESLDDLTLAMPEDLTIRWLKDLNVVAVSLANNHASDLGESGLAETKRALDVAGIRHFGQGETLKLPGLDIVGLTDLDSNGLYQTKLLTPALLDALKGESDSVPLLAMVHWGREYVAEPSARERELAEELRLRGVTAIIGGHPHVAGGGPLALAGGEAIKVYSLGNFLFDQTAAKASGQLVEVRVFPQGTLFVRTLPLPNLFDLARKR